MRSFFIITFVSATAVLAAASPQEGGRGWQSWDGLRDLLRPVTNYITQNLPEKTPTELVQDVRDTAVDIKDHPAVQGVATVVRPVQQWLTDAVNSLSKTRFPKMYETATSGAQAADRPVAQLLLLLSLFISIV